MRRSLVVLALGSLSSAHMAGAQQPGASANGSGPIVLLDADYPNVISAAVTPAIAEWLNDDGFRVRHHAGDLTLDALSDVQILFMIGPVTEQNALSTDQPDLEEVQRAWRLPTPSAYSREEIDVLTGWVDSGGSVFLIIDHMPFPGPVEDVANAFGITLSNGFAIDTERTLEATREGVHASGIVPFSRSEGTLAAHAITDGRTSDERIDTVETYGGSAFMLPPHGISLLSFGPAYESLEPDVAWEFSEATPRVSVAGWSQGGVIESGQGRVAVFGEAGIFTKISPGAGRPPEVLKQNRQLFLNVVHWMSEPLRE